MKPHAALLAALSMMKIKEAQEAQEINPNGAGPKQVEAKPMTIGRAKAKRPPRDHW